jgi:hypothetical protein
VHTDGIGVKRARSIFRSIREAGLSLTEVFDETHKGKWRARGISTGLIQRVCEESEDRARRRWEDLQRRSLQLLHPGSSIFDVPDIPGLPPALCLRGKANLLRSPRLTVLLKSRDTETDVIIAFLKRISAGKEDDRTWCFCPFSKLEWELVESLLKLGSEVVLGLVSGIPKRVEMLETEYPGCRLAAIAPEPTLRSRWAQFSCIEAFYDLFYSLAREALLIHARKGGKTAARIKRAAKYNCRVIRYNASTGTVSENAISGNHEIRSAADKSSPADCDSDNDDDEFVFSL